jgi:ATP-dependent DNA ligase
LNIFEFLGVKADHRPKNKVTQLVKHWDDVPESKKGGLYLAEEKVDGIFCHIVKRDDGEVGLFSRTGMMLQNSEDLCNRFKFSWTMPMVYMAELFCTDITCSTESLSGIFNPNRVNSLVDGKQKRWLNSCDLFFHDMVSIKDFLAGRSEEPAFKRYSLLDSHLSYGSTIIDRITVKSKDVVEYAKTFTGLGKEGAVFKKWDGPWIAGHKGANSMKIVKGVPFDLLCIGAEEGTGKYKGKIVNLIFRWKNGKEIKAMLGKNYTHKDAEDMFEDYVSDEAFEYMNGLKLGPVGKIFTVTALQESSKGVLRLPKVGALRFDKTEPDF